MEPIRVQADSARRVMSSNITECFLSYKSTRRRSRNGRVSTTREVAWASTGGRRAAAIASRVPRESAGTQRRPGHAWHRGATVPTRIGWVGFGLQTADVAGRIGAEVRALRETASAGHADHLGFWPPSHGSPRRGTAVGGVSSLLSGGFCSSVGGGGGGGAFGAGFFAPHAAHTRRRRPSRFIAGSRAVSAS